MSRKTKIVAEGGTRHRLLQVDRNIGTARLPGIDFFRILLYS
jgi:hypothetical protein